VTELLIAGGHFKLTGPSNGGAALGTSGASDGWESSVDRLVIAPGDAEAVFDVQAAEEAAAIGTGRGAQGSLTSCGSIEIQNGSFNIVGLDMSTGIGAGRGSETGGRCVVDDLVIRNGSFAISGETYGAGIGAGEGYDRGNSSVRRLHIENGSFAINCADLAAGIGTGTANGGASSVGSISIEDGSFRITSGSDTAAIGAGCAGRGRARVELVRIENGSFNIQGGVYVSGIGAGSATVTADSSVGTLHIENGSFTIAPGMRQPAIGSGYAQDSSRSTIDQLVIADGDFDLTGAEGAAVIGTAQAVRSSNSTVRSLLITGGSFSINGGTWGPGIGAGWGHTDANSSVGSLRIEGGSFTIKGGFRAPGIGSGRSVISGPSFVESIVIAGGSLDITGGELSTGIGSCYSDRIGHSFVKSIVIEGGLITIHGDSNRTGIGVSEVEEGSESTVDEVLITGGSLKVTGSIALGAIDGSVNSISIGGKSKVKVDCFSLSASSCINVPSVHFGSSSIRFQVQNRQLLNCSALSIAEPSDVLVQYRVLSEGEDLVDVPRLHIQSLLGSGSSSGDSESVGVVTIGIVRQQSESGTPVREFVFDTSQFVGFMIFLPASDYSVMASGSFLCASSSAVFPVSIEAPLYRDLILCATHSPAATVPTLPFTTFPRIISLRPRVMLIFSYLVALTE
jgi:hypothetical protein